MGTLLFAPWGALPSTLLGDEKSIIVETAKAARATDATDASDDADLVIATDQPASEALEPIALSSDLEPELADPEAAPGAEPTLSDEYLDVLTPRQRAAATVDAVANQEADADQEFVTDADEALLDDEAGSDERPTIAPIHAASFNGVTPGVTTRAELLREFGEPASDAATGKILVYRLEGFTAVTATLERERLIALRVELAEPATPEQLIARLSLAAVRPAVLTDDAGVTLTTAFPECGVTFVHGSVDQSAIASDGEPAADAQADDLVQVIVLRPIEAAPFIRRAANSDARAYAHRIADLEAALRLDPKNSEARWLLAQVKLATGSAVAAETLSREAVDLEPRNDDYRLEWAKCLKHLARYDQAVEQTRAVLEGTTATPIIRAQALEQMASLAALGSREVQGQAVPLHNKAIELADTLTESDNAAVCAQAHHLLVAAHLAVAERIAVGTFKDKQEFVAQWISRASALAEQMIESGEGDVSLRLLVATSALAAGEHLESPINPQMWIEEAEQAATELTANIDDELARAEIDWQLGLAYLYATELSHRRTEPDAAFKYGALAQASLEAGKACRHEMPDTEFVMGRLFFQIGATYAVHRTDHTTACQWYDQAVEPLSQPVPVTLLASPSLHGDALVSMAVSYWEIGDRDRAYELTGAGVELIEQGIAEGLLAKSALDVPQSNFDAMSRALGKIELTTPGASTTAQATPAKPAAGRSTGTSQVAEASSTPTKRSPGGRTQRPQLRTANRGTQRR